MNGKIITEQEISQIMEMYFKGMKFVDIGNEVGRSRKTVESVISRHRGIQTKAFNFPQITHARRFGA